MKKLTPAAYFAEKKNPELTPSNAPQLPVCLWGDYGSKTWLLDSGGGSNGQGRNPPAPWLPFRASGFWW